MLLSIVTGTYNRLPALQAMMQSARGNLPVGLPFEFVVVDGGSDDGTLDYLRDFPDVKLIEHGELRGAVKAFCDGAKAANGKYVLLANDDIIFHRGSIVPAILHLETHPDCGAVAFADNRPMIGKRPGQYAVLGVPRADKPVEFMNYAQVGLFRRWLGDYCLWWGDDDPDFTAHTYGGDNYLSARIWECGYSVDKVEPCKVDDGITIDNLRDLNKDIADSEPNDPNIQTFNKLFPQGVPVATKPKPDQVDKELFRVLYLPIYEANHVEQHRQKKGLREAMSQYFWVWELDYIALPPEHVAPKVEAILKIFDPDIVFTQAHGADRITVPMLQQLRAKYPRQMWINWNGDYWPHGLTSEEMMELLAFYDLQLVVNASVIPQYEARGIKGAYWQIGYEDADPAPEEYPPCDVVMLGNCYSESRKRLEHELSGYNAHFYGDGWAESRGNTLYDFEKGLAIYRKAKVIISDNDFPDAYGFVSNRLFQALAAGGGIVLQQKVKGLQELTGFIAGQHYLEYTDFNDLHERLDWCLNPENEDKRQAIAEAGTAFCHQYHSFDARVRELFAGENALINRSHRTAGRFAYLRYLGRNTQQFGIKGLRTGNHYTCNPGQPLAMAPQDAEILLRQHADKWQLVPEGMKI